MKRKAIEFVNMIGASDVKEDGTFKKLGEKDEDGELEEEEQEDLGWNVSFNDLGSKGIFAASAKLAVFHLFTNFSPPDNSGRDSLENVSMSLFLCLIFSTALIEGKLSRDISILSSSFLVNFRFFMTLLSSSSSDDLLSCLGRVEGVVVYKEVEGSSSSFSLRALSLSIRLS